jgi:hypothetical protein
VDFWRILSILLGEFWRFFTSDLADLKKIIRQRCYNLRQVCLEKLGFLERLYSLLCARLPALAPTGPTPFSRLSLVVKRIPKCGIRIPMNL